MIIKSKAALITERLFLAAKTREIPQALKAARIVPYCSSLLAFSRATRSSALPLLHIPDTFNIFEIRILCP